ncbi:MAG: thiolase family protein [Cyanobacteria bacterium]|nr:thiolase family protein [Cyanobacteriota bacterium]
MTESVYLINGARTPIGSFLGQFQSISAPILGSLAIQATLEKSGVAANQINEVIMGCVLPAGQGQAPARQAMIKAGIPTHVGATTINKVCGSGLKAVMYAANQVRCEQSDFIVAGGMESMSQAPFYQKEIRSGNKMGHVSLLDGMILDGLWDPYNNFHMGNAAEMCVQKYQFSREAQDEYASQSYKRALDTLSASGFKEEIVAVPVPQRKGDPLLVDGDEQPLKGDISKLSTLRPAFQKEGGTITAGNASSINDGAAAVLVASESAVKAHHLNPMAKILGYATFSQDPAWFTTAPVGAIQKVLKNLNLSLDDIDLFEINEAFAVVVMAAQEELKIPLEKINVRGGAIALGHPIGASGARILVTLLHSLKHLDKKLGLATLCIGGGEAVAMVVERCD